MRIRSIVLLAFAISCFSTLLFAWWGMQAMLVNSDSLPILVEITLTANIIGAVIGYLLLNPTVKSLQRLNQQVNHIAEQQFESIETISSPKELHSLSHNINHMVMELEHAFQELNASEREKTQLIAHLGHDIKTPITALQNQLEALQDGLIDDSELTVFYQQMGVQVERMSHLTHQLMEVALIERDKSDEVILLPTQSHEIKLDQLLVNLLAPMQIEFSKREQLLKVQVPDNLTPLWSDASKLQRILSNLLTNASKYSATNTTIQFNCYQTEKGTYFEVKDEGIGIADSDLPYIFDRLYRVESSRSQTTGGSGLGLYISRNLANQLGGQLSVTSELGKGSCFTLYLPNLTQT